VEFDKPPKSTICKCKQKRSERNNPQLKVFESFKKLFFLSLSRLYCLSRLTLQRFLSLPRSRRCLSNGRVGEFPYHEKGKTHNDRSKDYINPFPWTLCTIPWILTTPYSMPCPKILPKACPEIQIPIRNDCFSVFHLNKS